MKRDAVLPPFCFKTGVPTNSTVTRKFVWKSRLENYHGRKSLLMMIVTRIFAQRAVVEIPLCKKQQTKRIFIVLFSGFSAALTAFLGLRSLLSYYSSYSMLWFCLFVGLMLLTVSTYKILRPVKIDENYVRLRGVHESILEQLPRRSDWSEQVPSRKRKR